MMEISAYSYFFIQNYIKHLKKAKIVNLNHVFKNYTALTILHEFKIIGPLAYPAKNKTNFVLKVFLFKFFLRKIVF